MATIALQIKFCKQYQQPGDCGTSAAERCLHAAPVCQLLSCGRWRERLAYTQAHGRLEKVATKGMKRRIICRVAPSE